MHGCHYGKFKRTVANEGDQVILDDKNTAENFAESVGTIS